jgi:hypothetical protein
MENQQCKTDYRTRSRDKLSLIEPGRSKIMTFTVINDPAGLWNIAPDTIKNCVSLNFAKINVKKYVSTLSI